MITGTVCAAWLVRSRPQLVASLVLVDPVCFLLVLPDICSNFVYARPASAVAWAMRVAAGRELYTAHTLYR